MNKEGLADHILYAMNNVAEMLAKLEKTLDTQATIRQGLDNFLAAIAEGKTRPDQIAGMLEAVVKVQKKQTEALGQLTSLMIVYLAGGNFTTDAVRMLRRLGRGEDALKQMFKDKLKPDSAS